MNHSDEWWTLQQALGVLDVKPQTLYAYVSRGLVRAVADPADSRRSLYARHDVEALAARRSRSRKRSDIAENTMIWGDPVLESGISEIRDGQLYFGPRRAADWAETERFETVAKRHWQMKTPLLQRTDHPPPEPFNMATTAKARGFAYLASLASKAPTSLGRSTSSLHSEAWALLDGFIDALLGTTYPLPLHERFGETWGHGDSKGVVSDAIRRALILVSDHELNASSFAVRVAASTGAPLPAAVLAGLAALSGARHGEVTATSYRFMKLVSEGEVLPDLIGQFGNRAGYEMGFGHKLYPQGDPRAAALLSGVSLRQDLSETLAEAEKIFGWPANIDAALAILALHFDLPGEAPFVIFAAGRMSGWLAHALEQLETDQLIRPRARFVRRTNEADSMR